MAVLFINSGKRILMNKKAIILKIFLISCVLFFSGCSGGSVSQGNSFKVVVLGSGTVTRDSVEYPYQLLRIEVPGKEDSYAQWLPANGGSDSPAVMLTDPYGGITWNGDNPDPVKVYIRTPQNVFDDAFIYLLNGFSVLNVFGRFYAEGDIQNDVDDMVAGLMFLARQPGVMKDHIAVSGGSWGGFESLYASAHAPDDAVPRVGVALYPVSEFYNFHDYITSYISSVITDVTKRNQYIDFFLPYAQRIEAAADGDYSLWTHSYLLSKLRTPYLVVHDQWDTLIPFNYSTDLVSASSGKVQGIWFLKGSAVDLNSLPYGYSHGDLQIKNSANVEYGFAVYLTLSLAYLLRGNALETQVIYNLYDQDALLDFILYLKTYKDSGTDMEWAAARLLDLADERVLLYNMDSGAWTAGETVVSQVINTVWGTELDGSNVRAYLATGLPPY